MHKVLDITNTLIGQWVPWDKREDGLYFDSLFSMETHHLQRLNTINLNALEGKSGGGDMPALPCKF